MRALSQICPVFFDKMVKNLKNPSKLEERPGKFIEVLDENNVYYHFKLKWKGYSGENVYYVVNTLTDVGYCKTFNLLDSSEIFNTETLSPTFKDGLESLRDFYITQHGVRNRSSKNWSFESGYIKSTNFQYYPLKSMEANANLGLKFDLRNIKDSNIPCEEGKIGYKLLLHNPFDWPELSKNFIQISPQHSYNIKIKPHITKTSESLESFYNPQE